MPSVVTHGRMRSTNAGVAVPTYASSIRSAARRKQGVKKRHYLPRDLALQSSYRQVFNISLSLHQVFQFFPDVVWLSRSVPRDEKDMSSIHCEYQPAKSDPSPYLNIPENGRGSPACVLGEGQVYPGLCKVKGTTTNPRVLGRTHISFPITRSGDRNNSAESRKYSRKSSVRQKQWRTKRGKISACTAQVYPIPPQVAYAPLRFQFGCDLQTARDSPTLTQWSSSGHHHDHHHLVCSPLCSPRQPPVFSPGHTDTFRTSH
ncbi:uncharacterized protein B0T23DRAFT_130088 [Neurospora hispaniola]|uniref:Uncharacterized protein n=1 Tax=Neurospora hispaniola TaxID=588809 RepID=A0AAJ0IB33_9PEZI|nr:hypothetical protein B0T23DRAFT_130088 [Neurospora hispaniola]